MHIDYKVEFCTYRGVMRLRPRQVVATEVILPLAGTARDGTVVPLALVRPGGLVDDRPLHTDRGHIVGLRFGGPENSSNLVPMYGGFNSGAGHWGKFETALEAHLGKHGNAVDLDVTMIYADKADVIPSEIRIEIRRNRGEVLPEAFRTPLRLIQTAPIAYHMEPHEFMLLCGKLLQDYQNAMEEACWYVELQATSGGRDPHLRVSCIQPGEVDFANLKQKQVFYASRPYAVLDFIEINFREDYKKIGGPNMIGGMNNGDEFTPNQRSFLLQMNVVRSLGYIKSDLFGVVTIEPFANMMLGSTDAAAEIDHIWPRQRAGSNRYSNARLISSKCNQTLKSKGAPEAVAKRYREVGGFPDAGGDTL